MAKQAGPEAVAVVDEPVKDEGAQPSEVTVDFEKPEVPVKQATEAEQLAEAIRVDFEKLYGGRLKQVEDSLSGARRINERLQRELADVQRKTITPAPAVVTPTRCQASGWPRPRRWYGSG